MIGIVPDLFRQRECRRHDAVQKDRVGAEEVEKRRQLLLDLGADRLERSLVAQELGDAGQPCIEELAMVALADQEIDEVGRERREIYPARLPSYEIQRKGTGAECSNARVNCGSKRRIVCASPALLRGTSSQRRTTSTKSMLFNFAATTSAPRKCT